MKKCDDYCCMTEKCETIFVRLNLEVAGYIYLNTKVSGGSVNHYATTCNLLLTGLFPGGREKHCGVLPTTSLPSQD